MTLAREIGDRRSESRSMFGLGRALLAQDRIGDARACFEHALEEFREIGDLNAQAVAAGNLGDVSHILGRQPEARAFFERHLDLSREIGARYPEGFALAGLAMVVDELGEAELALRLAEESLAARLGSAPGGRGARVRSSTWVFTRTCTGRQGARKRGAWGAPAANRRDRTPRSASPSRADVAAGVTDAISSQPESCD